MPGPGFSPTVRSTVILSLRTVILVVVLTLTLGIPSVRAASMVYVRPAGSDTLCNGTVNVDYSAAVAPNCAVATIEKGIALVDSGGTVQVASGTYTPAGNRLVIDKAITVQAEPALAVRPKIVVNYGSWSNCAIQIAADGVVFDGFEVDNSARWSTSPRGYLVGDYGSARNGWTVRNCDIHHARNAIRPIGNNVTIEYNDLHETESDLINCQYGSCFGLKVRHNWLHSHHQDMGGKPAGVTYNVSSSSGADVEISYNYVWACRTFIDFQHNGGLGPANKILVAHNTVDYWIGDLMDPVGSENSQQMSIAWWTTSGTWNGPNFEIRDNLFTRQRWYQVVDTDTNLQGQITLDTNMFWQWHLRDDWYPDYAYANEWPAARGAVGWPDMGAGNEFVMSGCLTGDPLYVASGTRPDQYYALQTGSPARGAATDGTEIGAWQDQSSSVQLADLRASRGGAGVRIRWRTLSEIDHAGFRILREAPAGNLMNMTPRLIAPRSAGGELDGATYRWIDRAAPLTMVRYWLEDVDTRGVATRHGPLMVPAQQLPPGTEVE